MLGCGCSCPDHTIQKYGASGKNEREDSLQFLPYNTTMKRIPPHILDQFDIERYIGSPKEATLINDKDPETMEPLEPPRF
jgi:hypothetical protein